MKSYKLIKEYPGSPEVGTIVKDSQGSIEYTEPSGKQYTESSSAGNIFKTNIENHPEFWEVQKFEILQYVQKDKLSYTSKRRGGKDHEKYWNIHSVKRLSDGEIFTVGDKITGYWYKDARSIQTIRTCPYTGMIRLEQNKGFSDLVSATKAKQPIFLTHDGKDIFEGDTIWWVRKDSTSIIGRLIVPPGEKFGSDMTAYFLTREAAEDYIERNKPRLSIEDCFKILQKSFLYGNGFEKEIEKYVRKNNK